MNCATHNDIAAVAFCRTCGKPLCGNCTRDVRGVIYCEACLAARMEGAAPPVPGFVPPQAAPQTGYQQFMDQGLGVKVAPLPGSGPNPALAGILAGFFPFGVGAVYTGQYAKGLAHLLIFTGLVWGLSSGHFGGVEPVLGIAMGFFVVYQIIDAVRSAHAIRMGAQPPDPFGFNRTFGMSERAATISPSAVSTAAAPAAETHAGPVPTAAVILIGLGVLFLLQTAGVFEFNVERIWPLFL